MPLSFVYILPFTAWFIVCFYSDSEILCKEVNGHLYPLLAVIKIECLVPACYLIAGRKSVRTAVEHMQFNGYFIRYTRFSHNKTVLCRNAVIVCGAP